MLFKYLNPKNGYLVQSGRGNLRLNFVSVMTMTSLQMETKHEQQVLLSSITSYQENVI